MQPQAAHWDRGQCCVFGTSFEQLAVLIAHGVHKDIGSKDNHHKLFRRSVVPNYPWATLIFKWHYKLMKCPPKSLSLERKLVFTFISFEVYFLEYFSFAETWVSLFP